MRNEPFTAPPNPAMRSLWLEDRTELALLPPGLYLVGLVRGDAALLGWAVTAWAVGFPIWCAWTIWRVTDRMPADDTWRAIATLVLGGAPWLALLPISAMAPGELGWAIAFPLVFAPGVWSTVAARRRYLPPLRGGRRAALLSFAAVLCFGWAVAWAALAWGLHLRRGDEPGFLLWLFLPLMLLALYLGVRLAWSARKGFTPGRPLTAASLLADPPTAPSP